MQKRNVLVTGASRGIGAAIAFAFARQNYHVFLNSAHNINALKTVAQAIETTGGSCTLVPGNIGDAHTVQQIFATIHSQCPALDVLVNNAGISAMGLLQELDNDVWQQLLATNLSAPLYTARAAIPAMIRQQHGKIINISSIWGLVGASCEVAYSATKGGLNSLTKALAKELAPSNIQVNGIACGVIDTAMNQMLDDDEREALKNEIPAYRFGTPEEVADLVLDLAQKHPYLTGQIITLDGGLL